MAKKADWQSLELKLSRGKPFEDACIEAGIDETEAINHLKKRANAIASYDSALHTESLKNIQEGFKVLRKIAKDGPRRLTEENKRAKELAQEAEEEGSDTRGIWFQKERLYHTDLEAAKSLVKYGLELRKQTLGNQVETGGDSGNNGESKKGGIADLWDLMGPWKRLRDPTKV